MITGNLYRWVDAKAAQAYVRSNKMVGRHCHYLPKSLSGEFHSRRVRGLSFGMDGNRWAAPDTPVCFVLDRAKLNNKVAEINGQAAYVLTQHFEYIEAMRKSLQPLSLHDREHLDQLTRSAIADSSGDADEAFVIGDIKMFGRALVAIHAIGDVPTKLHSDLENFAQTWEAVSELKTAALSGPGM